MKLPLERLTAEPRNLAPGAPIPVHPAGGARLLSSVLLGSAMLLAGSAFAAQQDLHGHVPAAVGHLQPINRLAAAERLNLALSLPLRNAQVLTNLLREIYDPSSPNYHHYLTPQQFAQQFGATEIDYEALVKFVKQNGFTVTERHPNRLVLGVRGAVGDIEKALHVTMRVYQHPNENRTFYAPDVEPSLDLATAVLHVSGLDNFSLPFPKNHKGSTNSLAQVSPKSGSGPGGNYMGYDFRNAYVPGTLLTGLGQSVGLLEFDGYFDTDVSQYLTQAGLPQVPQQIILIGGFNGAPGPANAEVALDIDMAIAMAPGLSQVLVYEAPSDISFFVNILSRMANDNLAKQLSCSWGGGPPNPAGEQIFLQMAAQGQSFFDAQGDSDAFPAGQPILFPGESPNITQVGGTTLSTTGPLGAWTSEKAWNWGGGVGTCGGISVTYSIPPWQQGISMGLNKGSTTMRNLPDVALTADNIYIIADNGTPEPGTGGTSAAAPLWAGFVALINQQAAQTGQAPLGFINPAVYAIGKGPDYGNAFRDTTLGDNTWAGSPNLFFAVSGYDLCTGWGTPAGTNLINLLAPPLGVTLAITTNFVTGGNGNGLIDPDECNSFFFVLTNYGPVGVTNISATLSSPTPGVFIPQPTVSFPDLPPLTSATNPLPFTISTTPDFICGVPIVINVSIKSQGGPFLSTLQVPTGTNSGVAIRFDNFQPVIIPPSSVLGTNSTIAVSNIVGTLDNVAVSLFLNHPFDASLTLQLVAPDGATVNLSANNGGGANFGVSCSPDSFRTTFSDQAPAPIASGQPPFVGSFRPDQPLAAFAGRFGTNVNGLWQLHMSDSFGFTGTNQCWSLFLTPASCAPGSGQCPGVDLAIGMVAAPSPAVTLSNIVYTISVTNNGPGVAKGVVVTHNLDPTTQFISANVSQGGVSQAGGVVTCTFGNLSIGAVATATVTVKPLAAQIIFSTASVTSTDPDLNPLNNAVTVSTVVTPPVADLAVGIAATPSPTVVGGSLTYTISVTNNGPAAATFVVVSNTLPPSVLLNPSSATYSQGSVILNPVNNVFIFNVGLLNNGATATASITGSPQAFGIITATAVGRAVQTDPFPANNTATVQTSVAQAADLGLTLVGQPNQAVLGSNVTFTITVTNIGPNQATNVVVNQSIPAGAIVSSFSSSVSNASISINNGTLTCNLGVLDRNRSATITLVVTTIRQGTLTSTATVTAAQADVNPSNNTATAIVQVSPPFINIVPVNAVLRSESGPVNGAIDPGETVTVRLYLENVGNVDAVSVQASLQTNSSVLPLPPLTNSYGRLVPIGTPKGNAVFQDYRFKALGTNGGTVVANLLCVDNPDGYTTNATFIFQFPTVGSFSNTTTMYIPQEGEATNGYPSVITVSNMSGQVSTVTATLMDLSHDFVNDVNVLLVGPAGTNGVKTVLMSHVAYGFSAFDVTLTFDDAASATLPSGDPISSGTYQPTAYNPPNFTDLPPGPYSTRLSDFSGVNPNGSWSLYVLDDSPGDSGIIVNGWSLTLTTLTPLAQSADVGLTVSAAPEPLFVGDTLTYNFVISNAGPATASIPIFSNALPANVTLLSASLSSKGNLVTNASAVTATLAPLAPGASANLSVAVQPGLGLVPNNAPVFSAYAVTNPITVPNPGTAAPYPSSVTVSNAASLVSVLGQVRLTLSGLTHSYPSNLNLLLVNPVGSAVLLMSHAGGSQGITNLTLTFDDTATATVPASGGITNGTYRPTAYSPTFPFPLPAPGLPYTNSLAVFNGTNLNGVWSLYAYDDAFGGFGGITNWTLSLTSFNPVSLANSGSVTNLVELDLSPANNRAIAFSTVNLPLADMAVLANTANPGPVILGSNTTFTVTVTNLGPGTAYNVAVTNALSLTEGFISATPAGYTHVGNVITFTNLGPLPAGASTNVSFTLAVTNAPTGVLTNLATVSTASADAYTNNNSVANALSVPLPGPNILPASPSNIINPGQTVTLALSLTNAGVVDANNVLATLLATNNVLAPSGPTNYGTLVHAGPTVARSFTFTAASGSTNPLIVPTLQLRFTNNLGVLTITNVSFTNTLSSESVFANSASITIPNAGVATPYPSSLTLSNLSGVVAGAKVTLYGFSHSFPNDVNVLLVSPSGRNVLLMSHTGSGFGVNNLTLTFDDAAPNTLPNDARLQSTSYKPGGYGSITFPRPAASPPYGAALANVLGTVPNGTWALYVYDSSAGDSGSIASGWSLDLLTVNTLTPAADLAVGLSLSTNLLGMGASFTNTLSVTNLGPADASGVVLTATLPPGFTLNSSTRVPDTINGTTYSWNLGLVPAGSIMTIAQAGTLSQPGTFAITANVTGAVSDLYPANNSAQQFVTVSQLAPTLHATVSGGLFHLTLSGLPGARYVLLTTTNLAHSNWLPVSTNTASPQGTIQYTNPITGKALFYRAVH
jgi:uncharacterized repeat protein (TIGR01451 family)